MKDIKGYEGLYAITEDGQVWSYRRKRFLTPVLSGNGYLTIHLSSQGKPKTFLIHRLVAETYIANPNNLSDVNHIDENKLNNNISNLEWITHKENVNHGTCQSRKGQKCWKSVYCVELNKTFNSIKQAATYLGIDTSSISKACKGKLKIVGGYHWQYTEKIEKDQKSFPQTAEN